MPASDQSAERLDAHVPGAFPEGNDVPALSITQQTLPQALFERRAEYCRPERVRIKVGTWNVAGLKGTEKDIGAWFVQGKGVEKALAGLGIHDDGQHAAGSVEGQESRSGADQPTALEEEEPAVPGGEDVGIYALGLQEVVDVTSPTEALRPFTDPSVANRWKAEIEKALPAGYQLVAEQQLIGLLLLVYASPEVMPHVKSVSTTSVGTGLMGYMGNKGAVTARIVLGETTRLAFVNCHLAAGNDKTALERRNWDAGQIESRTRFAPITDAMDLSQGSGERLGEEDFAFWFGDLNYRLEGIPGDDVRRLLTIHTKGLDPEAKEGGSEAPLTIASNTNDAAKPSSSAPSSASDEDEDAVPLPPELDPASLHTTLACLLPHDELHQQQRQGKAFHDGWKEGPIRFLPSYKYDVGKIGVFDSSEKKRGPSWCDRILYRTRASKLRYEAAAKEKEEARKRDEEMKAKGLDKTEDVLYDYDPDTDGGAPGDKDAASKKDDFGYDEYDEYDEYNEYNDDEEPEPEHVTTKEGYSDEIQLEYYTSHMRVRSSDHKPLDAVFALKFDAVMPDLKAAIHQEVARELDRQENEGRPSIAVVVDRSARRASESHPKPGESDGAIDRDTAAFDGVDFNDIQYAKTKHRSLTIANTGRVPATFWFADRPVSDDQPQGPFPKWLSVTFDRAPDPPRKTSPDNQHIYEAYTLQPAEVCNAELKLSITTMDLVKNLNEGTTMLDEILVLRVENGRDHFIPVRGRWLQSSLARSIEKLVRIPEGGIRKLQGQQPVSKTASPVPGDTKGGRTNAEEPVRWSVPRELFRLTEALEDMTERAVAEWEMTKDAPSSPHAPWADSAAWPFVLPKTGEGDGNAHEDEDRDSALAAIFNALDTDTPLTSAFTPLTSAFTPQTSSITRAELLASALLTFLSSLTDGVIPAPMAATLESGLAQREKERGKQTLNADDEKMFVLETLSSSPAHTASFLLLVSMLEHVVREVVNAILASSASSMPAPPPPTARSNSAAAVASTVRNSISSLSDLHRPNTGVSSSAGTPRQSTDLSLRMHQLPSSPKVSVRRKTLSKIPAEAVRQLVVRNYAAVFAEVMVRYGDEETEGMGGMGKGKLSEKEMERRRERLARVVEVFVGETR